MRLIVFLISLTIGSQAIANEQAKDFKLTCMNSVAVLRLWADGHRFKLHFEDQFGSVDFPIYSGNVSPSTMGEVERAAQELKPFQEQMDISWDLSKCQVDDAQPFLISCRGMGEIASPAETDFAVTGLNTSTESGQAIGLKPYHMVNISFFLVGNSGKTDVMSHYIKLPFDQMHCSVNQPKTK